MTVALFRTLREGLPDRDEVFEGVYKRHADRVRGILFRLVPTSDLEEVCQETFVKVWKHLHFFRRLSSFDTWIYRIAVNTALDHLRSLKRRPLGADLDVDGFLSDQKSPEDELIHKRRVHSVLEALEEDLRVVLVLYLYENFKQEEIAHLLKIPLGTVKSRLHRAKEKAKELLEAQGVLL